MPYYGNGLAQGVYFAGDQIARAIAQRRQLQEAELRRQQQQTQWEAEHAIRQKMLAIQEATAQRAAAMDAVQQGNPMDAAGLEGAILRGRPYAGVPYQVPASEMGPSAPGADLPTTEGAALEPEAFTQPYQSTAELLATDPTAAAQAARIGQGTKRPVFGPQSTFGVKSVEQTKEEVDGKRRKDEARGRMTEASGLLGSAQPSERMAGLQLFVRALIDQDKLDPGALKTVMELHAGERNAAANDGFLEAAAPQLQKMANGEALNPDDTMAFGRAAWTHKRAPLVAHYFDEMVASAQASATPVAKAILQYTQLRMADTPDKDAFATVMRDNPQGGMLMLQPDAKGNLSRAPDFLRKDIEARAKLTGEDPNVREGKRLDVKNKEADLAIKGERLGQIRALTEKVNRAGKGALSLGEINQALKGLGEEEKRLTLNLGGEDQADVDEQIAEVRALRRTFMQAAQTLSQGKDGKGRAETPTPAAAEERPPGEATRAPTPPADRAALKQRRDAAVATRFQGKTWADLTPEQKQQIAQDLSAP